jgi:hypothetical protein
MAPITIAWTEARQKELHESGTFTSGCAIESVGNRLREAKTSGIVSSVERESQQARAQQHKTGRCQREESIGNQIVIVHDEPAV